MTSLKICRICLIKDVKLFDIRIGKLQQYYDVIIPVNLKSRVLLSDKPAYDDLPMWVCYECAALLHKYYQFREKCERGRKIVIDIMRYVTGPITYDLTDKIDREQNALISPLLVTSITNISYSGKDNSCAFQEEQEKSNSKDNNRIKIKQEFTEVDVLFEAAKDDELASQPDSDKGCGERYLKKNRYLCDKFWEKTVLSEEEAIKIYHERANNAKLIRAERKCMDCYKTFATKTLWDRHIRYAHSKNYNFTCKYCKMKIKSEILLKHHEMNHRTRYKCIRCAFTCYRSDPSYRTHYQNSHQVERSCLHCGVIFDSVAVLNRHVRMVHRDKEDMAFFCESCDSYFKNKRAYNAHIRQSGLHNNDIGVNNENNGASSEDDLSKTDATSDEAPKIKLKVRRRRQKQSKVKPTTCYQCGLHFATQKEYFKHHKAEHPGTSYYAGRHICEICGVSLAPGSLEFHRNLHTRKKTYSCDVCSRQFYCYTSCQRHKVTHTGEKRFGCSLCDKKFTQSNSMKLHYRTFHLRQPYPKRNRVKALNSTPANDEANKNSMMDIVEPINTDIEESVNYLTLN